MSIINYTYLLRSDLRFIQVFANRRGEEQYPG